MPANAIRFVCLDWGGTLMSEDGPADVPMAYWPDVTVIDGARDLVTALARGRTVCIATNATVSRKPDIEIALGRGGLLESVSDIFCFTEIGAKKSSAAFWDFVTRHLHASPAEIAILGDSLEEDVIGPSRHGITSVWFNRDARDVPAGVRAISRLMDFIAILDCFPDTDGPRTIHR